MLKPKVIAKKLLNPTLIFLLISIITVTIWFRQGFIYGGGDVGLTTYNPSRIAEIISKIWWEDTAPGFPRPQGLASLPLEYELSLLQYLGSSAFFNQALLFGVIIFSMGMGIYFLVIEVIEGKHKKEIALLSGVYYIVNPYMMVQVWHRFVHSTFFLAAGLPLIFLFWKRWIDKRDFSALFFFYIVNFLFVFAYSTLAFSITIWLLLTFYVFFSIFIPWQGSKRASNVLVNFFSGFILWILTNSWWLLPVLLVSPPLFSSQHSILSSVSTLIAISSQSIIPFSLAGLNSFYLFFRQEMGEVYSHPVFLFLPWIAVLFILVGIYKSIKNRGLIFWGLLFILAIFLAKGVASPFGSLFLFGFTKVFIIGVLRNPFEKIGILIPFAGSVLFGIGVVQSWNYLQKINLNLGRGLIILSLLLFFGIYHWPFWSGVLFGTLERPNFVAIPAYYNDANNWIKNQHISGNILHLPLSVSESLVYRWQYGYSGVESSTDFFTSNPSISMGFNLTVLDNALQTLDLIDKISIAKEEKIKELFRVFNVRFIVLHYDTDWQKSNVKDPYHLAKLLNSLSFLKKSENFVGLDVYEIKDEDYLGKLYLQSHFDYISGLNNDIEGYNNSWSWFLRYNYSNVVISDNKEVLPSSFSSNDLIVLPQKIIDYHFSGNIDEEEAVRQLPATKFLPGSPFYYLIRLKEKIQLLSIQNVMNNLYFDLAGKRLAEAYKLQKQDPNESVSILIKDYIIDLNEACNVLGRQIHSTTSGEISELIKQKFIYHQILLEEIKRQWKDEDKELISQALNLLNEQRVNLKMIPVNPPIAIENDESARQIFSFLIPWDRQYEIMLADSDTESVYKDNLSEFPIQIGGNLQKRKALNKQPFISYGDVSLNKGNYEISYPRINSTNLFNNLGVSEVEISSSQHNSNTFQIDVQPFSPGSRYVISFDYWVKRGNDPQVRATQDSDMIDLLGVNDSDTERLYQYDYKLEPDSYNKYWRKFYYPLDSRNNSSELTFQVIATPWNDCLQSYIYKKLCKNPEIKMNYERPTTFVLKNIQVSRILNNALILRSKGDSSQYSPAINVSFTKPKPLQYEGSFTLDKPSFLTFSETFDKGWDLTLSDESGAFTPTQHLIANMYGNAWFIDKVGTFKFKLQYTAQKYFFIGIYIAVLSYILLLIRVLWGKIGRRNR